MSDESVIEVTSDEAGEPAPERPHAAEDGEPVIGGAAPAAASAQPSEQEQELAERLRAALRTTAGDLPSEAIAGETLDEVAANFAAARPPQSPGADGTPAVPAGAPGRLGPPQLTAFEKIRERLARR